MSATNIDLPIMQCFIQNGISTCYKGNMYKIGGDNSRVKLSLSSIIMINLSTSKVPCVLYIGIIMLPYTRQIIKVRTKTLKELMLKINSVCQNCFMFMAWIKKKNHALMGLQPSLKVTVCFFQVERNKTIILKIYCSVLLFL